MPADMNLNERKTVQVYDDFMFSVRLLNFLAALFEKY